MIVEWKTEFQTPLTFFQLTGNKENGNCGEQWSPWIDIEFNKITTAV